MGRSVLSKAKDCILKKRISVAQVSPQWGEFKEIEVFFFRCLGRDGVFNLSSYQISNHLLWLSVVQVNWPWNTCVHSLHFWRICRLLLIILWVNGMNCRMSLQSTAVFIPNFLVWKCGWNCIKEWVTNRTFVSFKNSEVIIWPYLLMKGCIKSVWHKIEIQNT